MTDKINGLVEALARVQQMRDNLSGAVSRELRHDRAALETVIAALSRPQQALQVDREAVARIVDPKAWESLDRERAHPTKNHKNKEPWSWLRYYELGCEPSLAKADAILALFYPLGGGQITTA